jgi:hypothetical protein
VHDSFVVRDDILHQDVKMVRRVLAVLLTLTSCKPGNIGDSYDDLLVFDASLATDAWVVTDAKTNVQDVFFAETDVAQRVDVAPDVVADFIPVAQPDVPVSVDYPGVPGISPMLEGCPMFPSDNPWNRDVSSVAVHPNSAEIIDHIQSTGARVLRADFGANEAYGIPFNVATETQANVNTVIENSSESDPGPYPIPPMPRVEAGNDAHLLVIQRGTCKLFELYHASRGGDGWDAVSGAVFDLRSNTLRPDRWTSADEAGLPILPGLARYDEVTAGSIHHALRITFSRVRNAWVYPARHPGHHDDASAPAMGMRLRLRANYDIRSLTGQARVIAEALKRYGVFVADTGTNWYISGASDTRWNDDQLVQLRTIPGTAFDVLDTGSIRTR